MAHNIATINGQDAIAYIDDTPWHGLGIRKDLRGTPKELMIASMIEAASMGYRVGSLPIYLADGTEIKGSKASVRFADDGSTAATLGIVGDGYRHVQNAEACDVLQVMAQEFGCVPAAAGVLGQGEKCWMLMRLADAVVTPIAGDDVRGYFLLHWGHDGNVSLQLLGTPVRVVCQNTLSMATNGRKAWFTIRHTASASARLDEAAKLVKNLMLTFQQTGETFASMAQKNLNAAQLAAYIAQVIPDTGSSKAAVSPIVIARRDTVAKLAFYGRGAAMANQNVNTADGSASLWAAYNAVTEYFDHVRTAEAQSDSGLRRAQESAVFGGNAEIKAAALMEARQLLGAAA